MRYTEILKEITNPTELAGVIGKSISTASRIIAGLQEPDLGDISSMNKTFRSKLPLKAFLRND